MKGEYKVEVLSEVREETEKEVAKKSEAKLKEGTKKCDRFKLDTRTMTQIAMLSAIAGVLMSLEMPLWFAPSFYQMDLSEVPVLIGGFALGPVAGLIIALIKNLIKIVIKQTSTVGIGEFANFLIGCSFVLPSAIYYKRHKTRKGAVIAMIIGTVSITIVGSVLNAYVLLPFYAKAFGTLDAIVAAGTKVNPNIVDLKTFVFLAVAPFNMLKGVLSSLITFLIYKYIRFIMR